MPLLIETDILDLTGTFDQRDDRHGDGRADERGDELRPREHRREGCNHFFRHGQNAAEKLYDQQVQREELCSRGAHNPQHAAQKGDTT